MINKESVLIILGKGREDFQEVGNKKYFHKVFSLKDAFLSLISSLVIGMHFY